MAKPIGTLGTITTLTIGGMVYTDLDNLLRLYAPVDTNKYSVPRSDFSTGGYQVTSGKTLNLSSMQIHVRTAEAAVTVGLGYGDNDVGFSTATVPTTPKYLGNSTGNNSFANCSVAGLFQYGFGKVPIPATKYPFLESNVSSGIFKVVLYGYEV